METYLSCIWSSVGERCFCVCSIWSWESLTFVLSPYAFDHFLCLRRIAMSPCWWLFCWFLFFSHGIRASDAGGDCYFKSGRDTSVWNSQSDSQQLQTRFLFWSAQLQHKIVVIILVFSFAYCHWSYGLANETWNLKWVTPLPIFGAKRKWNPSSKTSGLLIRSATLWPNKLTLNLWDQLVASL